MGTWELPNHSWCSTGSSKMPQFGSYSGDMSYSLHSLKGGGVYRGLYRGLLWGALKGHTGSLDYRSYDSSNIRVTRIKAPCQST